MKFDDKEGDIVLLYSYLMYWEVGVELCEKRSKLGPINWGRKLGLDEMRRSSYFRAAGPRLALALVTRAS